MISFMENHPEAFEEAIQLSVTDKQPYSWRAAFVLWSVIQNNDAGIQKHIKRIVKAVKGKSDGHQKCSTLMELDESMRCSLIFV
jgi:hypothetical protein